MYILTSTLIHFTYARAIPPLRWSTFLLQSTSRHSLCCFVCRNFFFQVPPCITYKRNWIPPYGLRLIYSLVFIHMSIYEHYANRQTSQHILIIGHEPNIDPGIISFITGKDQFFVLFFFLNEADRSWIIRSTLS
jgi:hypothetical protein